ncbi:MAG TPA: hypothetical protein VME43_10685, partial [Bryobacteraceae bacterium]|nr:hypothetical protein [Bryobacteraceae bacterium]
MAAVHAHLDHLEGHHAPDGRGLFGAVYRAHTAFAKDALDLIIAEIIGFERLGLGGSGLEGNGRHSHADGGQVLRRAAPGAKA